MAGTLRPGMVRRMHGGVVTVFSPDSISGLQLWLKADSLSLADTDPVTTWEDSSSANNDATQSTAASKPTYRTNQINGLPAVSFDGGDVMASNVSMATKPFSAFAVVNFTNFSTHRTILGASADAGIQYRGNNSAIQRLARQGTEDIGSSTTSLSGGTSYRIAVTYSGVGAFAFYLNGAADGSGTSNQTFTASTLSLGANRNGFGGDWMLGLIAEVLFYDSVLSSTDRENVEGYLADKYAL